jgi:hypothetical protein
MQIIMNKIMDFKGIIIMNMYKKQITRVLFVTVLLIHGFAFSADNALIEEAKKAGRKWTEVGLLCPHRTIVGDVRFGAVISALGCELEKLINEEANLRREIAESQQTGIEIAALEKKNADLREQERAIASLLSITPDHAASSSSSPSISSSSLSQTSVSSPIGVGQAVFGEELAERVRYACNVPGCGKDYAFPSAVSRHKMAAHGALPKRRRTD